MVELYGAGALVTEVALDNDLNIAGRKQYIYIREEFVANTDNNIQARDLFGTTINVAHLIHELGHAWHAEENQFEVRDGYLIERVGPATLTSKLEKLDDGTCTRFLEKVEGLILEESLNTKAEEEALARFLGMPREKVQKDIYRKLLVPSNYQGIITSMGDRFCELDSNGAIERWRLTGDISELDELMYIMSQTDSYIKRNEPDENLEKKRKMFEAPRTAKMKEMFERCENDFFYDKQDLTPLGIVECSMVEVYDVLMNKLSFDIFNEDGLAYYKDFMLEAMRSGYVIMNRTLDILEDPNKKAEILSQRAEIHAQEEGKRALGSFAESKASSLGMSEIRQASQTLEKIENHPALENENGIKSKSEEVEI